MNQDELITKMRGRIAMCRRLAASTTDKRTAKVLADMADEGERDVQRILAEKVETIILTPDLDLPKA